MLEHDKVIDEYLDVVELHKKVGGGNTTMLLVMSKLSEEVKRLRKENAELKQEIKTTK